MGHGEFGLRFSLDFGLQALRGKLIFGNIGDSWRRSCGPMEPQALTSHKPILAPNPKSLSRTSTQMHRIPKILEPKP